MTEKASRTRPSHRGPRSSEVSLRARLARLRGYSAYAPLVLWTREFVPYIGWVGAGNVGDEALFLAHQRVLPSIPLFPVPNVGTRQLVPLVGGFHPKLSGPCLGGGTLIGNGFFRTTLECWLQAIPSRQPFMLGVGVEDPRFEGERSRQATEELRRWAPLLSAFDRVRVRGPLSRDVLADMGVDAEVVGDPALVLGDTAPSNNYQPGLLGINIGITDDLWGGDQRRVEDQIADFATAMQQRGWRIRLIPVWDKDLTSIQRLASRLDPEPEVLRDFLDLATLLDALRECHVFVGEKLHSVVLASTVFVPSIALEYRPKCRDFQASIDRDLWTVRTNALDAGRLVEMAVELGAERETHVRHIAKGVRLLRHRLMAASEQIVQGQDR